MRGHKTGDTVTVGTHTSWHGEDLHGLAVEVTAVHRHPGRPHPGDAVYSVAVPGWPNPVPLTAREIGPGRETDGTP